jgi:protein phosphatase
MMLYEFFSQTDPGLTRANNEDTVGFDAETQVCVVADGMGGYNAGEIASGMAVAFIKSEMARWLTQAMHLADIQQVRRALEICVENTNLSILKAAHANSQYSGMGTTLVVGVFQRDHFVVGHIGDSRCYRLREARLTQLTRDHSLLQEQLDAGLISPEEAASSTQKNLVTRALGVEESVTLEVKVHDSRAGDIFLMCTDGVTDMVSDIEILQTLMAEPTLEAMARRLVNVANANGGRDNISVLLARVSADAKKTTIMGRLLGR